MDRNTTKTTMFDDEVEFIAEYGTAVILIDHRLSRIHGDHSTGNEAANDVMHPQVIAVAGGESDSVPAVRQTRKASPVRVTHAASTGKPSSRASPKQGRFDVQGRRPANDESVQLRGKAKRRRKSA
jgi:hypothetical protein